MINFLSDPSEQTNPRQALEAVFNSPDATWRGRSLFHQCRCEFALVRDRHDEALVALGDAVAVGLFDLSWLDGCPILAPLRSSPRFLELRSTVAQRAQAIQTGLSAVLTAA